ncbi:MAG: hypothetical protein OEV73_09095, partial [Desulfobulbaceae bacterium]|nr:hypothetical protein [Desulfobulbaceae bacterium]
SGCYTLATQRNENNLLILDTAAIIRDLCADLRMGTAQAIIAARFHATLAALFCAACREIGAETRLKQVVCSGGVFQNTLFTSLLTKQLEADGFTVYTHRQTPPNDGGLALGQAVAGRAMHRIKS